nr:hypothetical protein Iba_chr02aCG4820 [Ipomoea batatas]
MARANGGRRSKRWVSGRAILSAASGSVGAAGYSAHAWSFKRRSFRRTPISVVCEGCDSAGVLRGFWYEVEGGVGSAGVLCSGRSSRASPRSAQVPTLELGVNGTSTILRHIP